MPARKRRTKAKVAKIPPRPKTSKKTPPKRRTKVHKRGDLLPHRFAFRAEIVEQIVALASTGLPRKYTAAQVGVGERTIQRWVGLGRDNLDEIDAAWAEGVDEDDLPELNEYGIFVQRLVAAEAKARGDKALVIAEDPDWRAKAWFLERVDHRTWGDLTKVAEVTHDENGDEVSAADALLDKIAEIEENERRFAAVTSDKAGHERGD